MANYTNFYETVKEAEMRLKGTIVVYDGEPYYVLCICDHKADGIWRIYLDPCGSPNGLICNQYAGLGGSYDPSYPNKGTYMDKWMEQNPNKILRKMMNSPSFNKFRPFPLGMMNIKGYTRYVERHPTRKSEQGLTGNMLVTSQVSVNTGKAATIPNITGPEFRAMVAGQYPSVQECISKLLDPSIDNDAAAFHRDFCIARGPIDTLYLGYKQDIVGILPTSSLASVRLGSQFKYAKEAVQELGLFGSVT